MGERILLGTRKGFFDLRREKGGWQIGQTAFLGDPISMLLRDPRDGALYAGQALGHFGVKLQRSTDDGKTWTETPAPAFKKQEGDEKGPSVSSLFSLETGGADQSGMLWCGTIPGGLFLSKDHGESWSLIESLWSAPERQEWFGGGTGEPAIDSICVDPRDSQHVIVAVGFFCLVLILGICCVAEREHSPRC